MLSMNMHKNEIKKDTLAKEEEVESLLDMLKTTPPSSLEYKEHGVCLSWDTLEIVFFFGTRKLNEREK